MAPVGIRQLVLDCAGGGGYFTSMLLVLALLTTSGAHDFDFLLGKTFRVRNRVLPDRLVGSDAWVEFDARLEDVRPIAAGLGNVDRFIAEREEGRFEGNSIRLFDPSTEEWTIWWVDSRNPTLRLQVKGKFENGRGEFFGEEEYRGRKLPMRFLWTDITETSARWEQAYRDPETGEWETNWTMEFTVVP